MDALLRHNPDARAFLESDIAVAVASRGISLERRREE